MITQLASYGPFGIDSEIAAFKVSTEWKSEYFRPFQVTIRKVLLSPKITSSALLVNQCAKEEIFLIWHIVSQLCMCWWKFGIRNLQHNTKKVWFKKVYIMTSLSIPNRPFCFIVQYIPCLWSWYTLSPSFPALAQPLDYPSIAHHNRRGLVW